ncbi:DUF427 domain-containing protein [Nitratireductor sp. GISD-1A_MAKvit]|uniref:DUF427 domain-containing protein n=1 Tax=Nitratireductor sp. GISD-1A_MAKvit TaxID=3234198 RepID=UPI0034660CE0
MTSVKNPAPGFDRNPDKRITIRPCAETVRVIVDGTELACTQQAKRMRESGCPEVVYIPFADINFALLERTGTRTHCPYKGDASYWRRTGAGEPGSDIMWAYENPFDEVIEIRDHGAFFTDLVEIKKG